MKNLPFVCLSVCTLSLPAWADEEKLNLSCHGQGKRGHGIQLEITRATQDEKCSAIAIDATTMGESPVSPVTVNSDWECEITKLSETKEFKEELIQMKVVKAVSLGSEDGKELRFETLRLVVETRTGEGAGIATTLGKAHSRIDCQKDKPNLHRYFPK